jgi:IMP and pyridine-specific 5'-nucleotidase
MAASRLKEQDDLIALIRSYVSEHPDYSASGAGAALGTELRAALAAVGALLDEHRESPQGSRLQKYCPHVGKVFLRLDLLAALDEYDSKTGLCRRRFVPPSFREIRELLNLATVRAAAPTVRLVTLDADETLYSDGGVMTVGSPMIPLICQLLQNGTYVAVVTAASYPHAPEKYAARFIGLLESLAFAIMLGAPTDILDKFYIIGGQCNYVQRCRVAPEDGLGLVPRVVLEELNPESWKPYRGVRWDHGEVQRLLDVAEMALRENSAALGLDVLVVRKERAVGIITAPPAGGGAAAAATAASRLSYEVLEEITFAVQHELRERHRTGIPYCAFNGSHDVFIDIGDKSLGIAALQGMLGVAPHETVHAGDRFTPSGNDTRARQVANTLWVAGPDETEYLLGLLLADMLGKAQGPTPASREVAMAAGAGSAGGDGEQLPAVCSPAIGDIEARGLVLMPTPVMNPVTHQPVLPLDMAPLGATASLLLSPVAAGPVDGFTFTGALPHAAREASAVHATSSALAEIAGTSAPTALSMLHYWGVSDSDGHSPPAPPPTARQTLAAVASLPAPGQRVPSPGQHTPLPGQHAPFERSPVGRPGRRVADGTARAAPRTDEGAGGIRSGHGGPAALPGGGVLPARAGSGGGVADARSHNGGRAVGSLAALVSHPPPAHSQSHREHPRPATAPSAAAQQHATPGPQPPPLPYGMTSSRAFRSADALARSRMRSQWESAGGVVVAHVHGSAGGGRGVGGSTSTPRSTVGNSVRSVAGDTERFEPRQAGSSDRHSCQGQGQGQQETAAQMPAAATAPVTGNTQKPDALALAPPPVQ